VREVLEGVDNGDASEEVNSEFPHCERLIYSIAYFMACLREWHTFLALYIKSCAQEVYLPNRPLIKVSQL